MRGLELGGAMTIQHRFWLKLEINFFLGPCIKIPLSGAPDPARPGASGAGYLAPNCHNLSRPAGPHQVRTNKNGKRVRHCVK